MEHNEKKIFEAYKKEDAYEQLKMMNAWIGNTDSKVSFALTFTGALIGIIFGIGKINVWERIKDLLDYGELISIDGISVLLIMLLYISSFISIMCFLGAIIARVKNPNHEQAVFFFGNIGNKTLENYIMDLKNMDEMEIVEGLAEQIHTNSKICSAKTTWYNSGIRFLRVTVILWFVGMVFQIM